MSRRPGVWASSGVDPSRTNTRTRTHIHSLTLTSRAGRPGRWLGTGPGQGRGCHPHTSGLLIRPAAIEKLGRFRRRLPPSGAVCRAVASAHQPTRSHGRRRRCAAAARCAPCPATPSRAQPRRQVRTGRQTQRAGVCGLRFDSQKRAVPVPCVGRSVMVLNVRVLRLSVMERVLCVREIGICKAPAVYSVQLNKLSAEAAAAGGGGERSSFSKAAASSLSCLSLSSFASVSLRGGGLWT